MSYLCCLTHFPLGAEHCNHIWVWNKTTVPSSFEDVEQFICGGNII